MNKVVANTGPSSGYAIHKSFFNHAMSKSNVIFLGFNRMEPSLSAFKGFALVEIASKSSTFGFSMKHYFVHLICAEGFGRHIMTEIETSAKADKSFIALESAMVPFAFYRRHGFIFDAGITNRVRRPVRDLNTFSGIEAGGEASQVTEDSKKLVSSLSTLKAVESRRGEHGAEWHEAWNNSYADALAAWKELRQTLGSLRETDEWCYGGNKHTWYDTGKCVFPKYGFCEEEYDNDYVSVLMTLVPKL